MQSKGSAKVKVAPFSNGIAVLSPERRALTGAEQKMVWMVTRSATKAKNPTQMKKTLCEEDGAASVSGSSLPTSQQQAQWMNAGERVLGPSSQQVTHSTGLQICAIFELIYLYFVPSGAAAEFKILVESSVGICNLLYRGDIIRSFLEYPFIPSI